jgi:hypothetical protein
MNLRKINKPHNFINRQRLPREVQQSAGHLPFSSELPIGCEPTLTVFYGHI